MHRLRGVAIAVAVSALAVTAIGAPAAAAPTGKGKVVFVQGIPGRQIDVCLDGKEVRSGMRYGRWMQRKLDSGKHTLKIFRSNPRVCKGTKIAQRSFGLDPDGDITIVASKGKKKLVKFNNRIELVPNGVSPYGSSTLAVRHAAMAPAVFMTMEASKPLPPDGFIRGSADSPFAFQKGDQFLNMFPTGFPVVVRALNAKTAKRLGGTTRGVTEDGRIQEHILVGAQGKFRWVVVDRKFMPTPVCVVAAPSCD